MKTSFHLNNKIAVTGNVQSQFITHKPAIMTGNEILKADLLDILFDNRNKQYGAYTLRKTYNNRLSIALGLSLSTVLLIFFLMRMDGTSNHTKPIFDDNTVIVKTVQIPDIKKMEPIIPKKAETLPQIKTQKLTTFEIKQDNLVHETVPDQRLLLNSDISNIKMDGIDATNTAVVKETAVVNTPVKATTEEISTAPIQREPEFPGGQQAWLNFLQKNLMAPAELEPGEKKTVSIRFYVSEEGIVTNFQVMQSAGNIFDNEVIRVLKKMPKWKPAIQNGLPVSRAFTQPVTFVGADQ